MNAAINLADQLGTWVGIGEVDQIFRRTDGWENPYTGFGTSRDKTIFSSFSRFYDLSDSTLELLYHGDDLAQRMIDTVPEEMLRKGYCLKLGDDKELPEKVLELFDELDVNAKLIEAMIWARLYGGCAIVVGADDGRPATMPLEAQRARRIDFLEVIDRRYLAPARYYTSGPKTGQPETYTLGNPSPSPRNVIEIHESRLILFGGARTSRTEKLRRGSWDHSYLQRPYEILRSFAAGFKAVEVLLSDGPQGVYSVSNLANLIGAGNRDKLENRIAVVDMFRSALRSIVVDADSEKFERTSFSFSGVPDVLDKLMLRLAASVPMPVTILMGQSPAGMNATGESDFRWFYDRIETAQTNYLAPRIRRLAQIALATREGPSGGKPAESIKIEFEPLLTLDPKAEAEMRRTVAETDRIYFDMGALTPEEIALSRFGDRGWQAGYSIDRDLRQEILDADQEAMRAGGDEQGSLNPNLLTPTANEAVVTVNQALAAAGLPPDPDPEIGNLKVAEYRARQEAAATALGEAEGGAEAEDQGLTPEPKPAPGGAPNGTPNGEDQPTDADGNPGAPPFPPKAKDQGAAPGGVNAPPGRGDPGVPAKPSGDGGQARGANLGGRKPPAK